MCEPPTANVHTMKVSEVTGDICSGIIFSHLCWVYKAGGQPSYLLCFQLLLLSYHNSFPTVKINLVGFFLCLNLRASRKRWCTPTPSFALFYVPRQKLHFEIHSSGLWRRGCFPKCWMNMRNGPNSNIKPPVSFLWPHLPVALQSAVW